MMDAMVGNDAGEAGIVDVADTRVLDVPIADIGADAISDSAITTDGGAGSVVINEINGAGVQYVELSNQGSAPIDLVNLALTNSIPADSGTPMPNLSDAIRFGPGTNLAPGELLIVVAERVGSGTGRRTDCLPPGGPATCYHAPFHISGSGNETIFLLSATNAVLDQAQYSRVGLSTGQTSGRLPHGTGSFWVNRATPGDTNQFPAVVNEISGSSPDYVEVYNASQGTVDMSNMVIADSNSAATPAEETPRITDGVRFPVGTILGPGEFLFVLAEQLTIAPDAGRQTMCGPCAPPDGSIAMGCFHSGFGISSSRGETIWLMSPRDTVLDSARIPIGVPGGATFGRIPDGTGSFGNTRLSACGPNQSL